MSGLEVKTFFKINNIPIVEVAARVDISTTRLYEIFKLNVVPKKIFILLEKEYPALSNGLSSLENATHIHTPHNTKGNNRIQYGECAALVAALHDTIASLKREIAAKDEMISLLKSL